MLSGRNLIKMRKKYVGNSLILLLVILSPNIFTNVKYYIFLQLLQLSQKDVKT